LDLRQLRCFIAVAEEMHFGRAAERLRMAPPALSRVVRALEDEIGAPLLERTTRAVALTRAGLSFLEDAQAILGRIEQAAKSAREASSAARKSIRIGAIDAASSGLLPMALARLREREGDVDIRLIEAMTLPQMQMLRSGRLDLALVRAPYSPGEFPFEALRQERMVVVLPEGHPLAARAELGIDALRDIEMIIPAKRVRPYAYDLVMAYFAAANCVPKITIETTEKPAILAMVAAGTGVSIVPDWVTCLRFKGVCYRPLTDPPPSPLPPGALVGMSWRSQQRHRLRDELIKDLRKAAAAYNPAAAIETGPLPCATRGPTAARSVGEAGARAKSRRE
jgi:DNA-binding transcriptional LysR family regulator